MVEGLRALLSSPPGPPPVASTLPTEWQDRDLGAMALRHGWGACSWEAGMVMKPILSERRRGPGGPAGDTSFPELERGSQEDRVRARPSPVLHPLLDRFDPMAQE